MHTYLPALATCSLFCSSLVAQAGPGLYGTPMKDTYLTTTASTSTAPTIAGVQNPAPLWPNGGGAFRQVQPNKSGFDGLKAGQFGLAMTVNSLNPYYTGQAAVATGVILGRYDISGANPVFTPTDVAKTLNPTTGNPFGLMIEPRDGLLATVDWPAGPMIAYRATRSSNGVDTPFGTALPLQNASGSNTLGTFIDPALGYWRGQLMLFYAAGAAIEARPVTLSISNGVLTKAVYGATPIAVVSGTAGLPHSPTPLVDAAGNVQGMFLAASSASDSDSYFAGLLGPGNAPELVWDNPNWQNNGGLMGSTFLFRNTADSSAVWRVEAASMIGSATPLGGTATITLHAPANRTTPVVGFTLAASTSFNPTPVQIPGWHGAYGLGTALLIFGTANASNLDETARWSAPVPNSSSLKGASAPLQALAAPVLGQPGLTNTAKLEIL